MTYRIPLPDNLQFRTELTSEMLGLTQSQIPRPIAGNSMTLRNDLFQISLYTARTAGEAVLAAAKSMKTIGGPFASGLCQPLKTLAVQHKEQFSKVKLYDREQRDITELLTSLMLRWAFDKGEDKVPYIATSYPVESVQVHLRDEVPKMLECCMPSRDVEAAMFIERVRWLHQNQVYEHTTHLNPLRLELLDYIIDALDKK